VYRGFGEGEGTFTACIKGVASRAGRESENKAVDTDRGKRIGKSSIAIEVEAFEDGYRLRHPIDDGEPVQVEYVLAA